MFYLLGGEDMEKEMSSLALTAVFPFCCQTTDKSKDEGEGGREEGR